MSNNKIALSSLSMDLKRVALGYWRGSDKMAERFLEEAIRRREEIDKSSLEGYLVKLLDRLDDIKKENDLKKAAEESLMFSTLFQNAACKIF